MELPLDICSLWAWGTVERGEDLGKLRQTSLGPSYSISQNFPQNDFSFLRIISFISFCEISFLLPRAVSLQGQ